MSGTGKTPGQAACEARDRALFDTGSRPPVWKNLSDRERQAWEAAAQAAIAEVVNPTAQDYDNAAEILRLRERLAGACDALSRIALGIAGDPSVAADKALGDARRGVKDSLTPAMTGAGAEHIARELLDPGNPGAWQRVADVPAEGEAS